MACLSGVSRDRVFSVAAGVTFYALLAIFPAIAAFVSLYGLVADATTINQHLALLSGVLPAGAIEIIGEQVKSLTSKAGSTLGFAFFFGLAISLCSANAGMKAMFDALNVVYDEDEKRGFIKLKLQALLFTLGALLFLLLALAAVAVIPVVLKLFPFARLVEQLLSILRWPILAGGVLLGLAVLYRYGPSRDTADWRWVTWGSAIAALLWIVGLMGVRYVANFGNYNETYGSLGGGALTKSSPASVEGLTGLTSGLWRRGMVLLHTGLNPQSEAWFRGITSAKLELREVSRRGHDCERIRTQRLPTYALPNQLPN